MDLQPARPPIAPRPAGAQPAPPQPDERPRDDAAFMVGRIAARTAVNLGWGVVSGVATQYAIGRVLAALPAPAPALPAGVPSGRVVRVTESLHRAPALAAAPAGQVGAVIPGGLPQAPGVRDAAAALRLPGIGGILPNLAPLLPHIPPVLPIAPVADGPRYENLPLPMNNQEQAALNDRVVSDVGGCTAAGMSIGMGIGSGVPVLGTVGGAILGAAGGAIVGLIVAHYHCESAAAGRR